MHPFFATRVPNLSSSAAQPVLQMRSIADVQRWLDTQRLSECSLQRLREAVAILIHPKPRQEDVQRLQSPSNWNVPQKRAQKKRPLPEVIEELKRKVLEAARKLHTQSAQISSSASGSAEQPGASSATSPAPQHPSFDILLASQRCNDLAENFFHPKPAPKSEPRQERPKEAFGLLQDCRKYKKDHWLGVEDEKQIDKIMKELVIESQPHFSSKLCRELYKHSKVGQILGPFGQRDSQGHWEENDHEHVRATAFNLTILDLASFLSGRDALRAEEYPCIASLEGLGVNVIRKSRQKIYEEKVLEILQNMPQTEILPLLPDYAQHEWLYRLLADKRDKAAGIPIQGPEALDLFCQELRNCREEDGEGSSEEDPERREFDEETRRIHQFRDECRRKWKEQGKTEEECRKMWPQALADWRAENGIAADFDAMQM